MADEKEEEKKKKEIEGYKGWLKGVGILEFLHAIVYGVCAILVMVLSNGTEIAEKVFNITEPIEGMTI